MKKLFLSFMGLMIAAAAYAVTPADPSNLSWYDCGNESGQSYLTFTLPTVDVNGAPLDIEMMGYRLYTDDDQIFTFNSTQYDNIWGSTTDIYYYNWESGSDLQSNGVYFYRTNAEGYERFFNNRIGVQVFYLNDNFTIGGVSNIVYTELTPQTELPTPANPTISEFIDYGNKDVGVYLGYEIAHDFDGNPVADDFTVDKYFNEEEYTILEPEKVSFSIFTDNDKIFTFTPEMFPGQVSEPLTQFPYTGRTPSGNIGFWNMHIGLTNVVEDGEEPFFTWRIGMQTHYTDGAQTSSSDIIYMEIYPQLKEAAEVTSTSFLADWSCNAENTFIINNFVGNGCGYFLHVVDKATQEEILVQNVAPANTALDEWGNQYPLPGATYMVEGLSPGNTYEYYVEVKQNTGKSYNSVVREVTLPEEGHGFEPGDVDHDGKVGIDDVTSLIDYLLGTGEICTICADVDPNSRINIDDVTTLIDMLLGKTN